MSQEEDTRHQDTVSIVDVEANKHQVKRLRSSSTTQMWADTDLRMQQSGLMETEVTSS